MNRLDRSVSDAHDARLCSQLQPLAEIVSGRRDLVLALHEKLPLGRASRYEATKAQITLSRGVLLAAGPVPPDLSRAEDRRAHADLVGTLVLCAAVAGHGLGGTVDVPDRLRGWWDLLDGLRACRLALGLEPTIRTWLRAALQKSCPVGAAGQAPVSATGTWYVGQVPAGVLTFGEAARVRHHLLLQIGPAGLGSLQQIVAGAVDAGSGLELLVLAGQLSELFGREDDSGISESGQAEDTVGRPGARSTDARVRPEDSAEAIPAPDRRQLADERLLARAAAGRVFDRSNPNLIRTPPTEQARSDSRRLAATLRRLMTPPAPLDHVPSRTPPGRTRMSELMRRDAQVAAQTPITARPWNQLRRIPSERVDLRVALSWDISGSRRAVHEELCDLAWSVSQATRLVEGNVAAVAWNDRVTPVVWPGRTQPEVVRPACGGRSGGGAESLRALDGALRLSQGRGTRILLVCSDGRIPNRRALQSEIDRLLGHGVTVLWLGEAWHPDRVIAVPTGTGRARAALTAALARAVLSS